MTKLDASLQSSLKVFHSKYFVLGGETSCLVYSHKYGFKYKKKNYVWGSNGRLKVRTSESLYKPNRDQHLSKSLYLKKKVVLQLETGDTNLVITHLL